MAYGLDDYDDPKRQGLLQFALAMMANSGPSAMPKSIGQILGASGMQGMEAYSKRKKAQLLENEDKRRDEEFKVIRQLREEQIKKAQAEEERRKQYEEAARASYMDRNQMALSAGGGPTNQAAAIQQQLPQNASSFDEQGFLNRIWGVDPLTAIRMRKEISDKKAWESAGGGNIFRPDTGEMKEATPKAGTKTEFQKLLDELYDPNTSPERLADIRARVQMMKTRPPNAALELKLDDRNNAKGRVSENLQSLAGAYYDLERLGAAVSTENTTLDNFIASARASGPGQ